MYAPAHTHVRVHMCVSQCVCARMGVSALCVHALIAVIVTIPSPPWSVASVYDVNGQLPVQLIVMLPSEV